jgi:hypothetical protein
MFRRSVLAGLAALALLGCGGAVPARPAAATRALPPPTFGLTGPICQFGSCFDYVYGRQDTDVDGASVTMAIAQPKVTVHPSGDHSLQELSLQSTDRKSTIEVGWTVDPSLNGDAKPHLFVFHWVNGVATCYNGCGFVQANTGPKAGMVLASPSGADFAMRFVGGSWWVYYNSQAVGHFPASLWSNGFTRAQVVQAFGEVAHATNVTCEQMGTGEFGHGRFPSRIINFTLYGTNTAPRFTVADTSPQLYDEGAPTPTSFFLGGPGTGPCTT